MVTPIITMPLRIVVVNFGDTERHRNSSQRSIPDELRLYRRYYQRHRKSPHRRTLEDAREQGNDLHLNVTLSLH